MIAAGKPLFVVLDGDIAQSLGHISRTSWSVPSEVLVIDGVVLWDFDYIDLGKIRMPSRTVPVTIKSLVFSDDPRTGQRLDHDHGHDHGQHAHGRTAITHGHDHHHQHDHGHATGKAKRAITRRILRSEEGVIMDSPSADGLANSRASANPWTRAS